MPVNKGWEKQHQVEQLISDKLQLTDDNITNAACAAIRELSYGWNSGDPENPEYIREDISSLVFLLRDQVENIVTLLGPEL